MAKRIVWSERAGNEKKEILQYWYKRNGNKIYSNRLNQKFKSTVKHISKHNYLGKATDIENVRVTVCLHYLIIYEITSLTIEVLTIFDTRRDPNELKI